jgi:hypothetical protein
MMRLLRLVLCSSTTLLLGAPLAESFASRHAPSVPRATTSTTLYYRDDVPPIGSSPFWETPNDFQQFLTQCSIQSFLFLLKSLRDDHTMQWLHDFTDPVLLLQVNATATCTSTTAAVKPKVKVSLAQAAQAALDNTDKALTEGGTTLLKQQPIKAKNPTETVVLAPNNKKRLMMAKAVASKAVLQKPMAKQAKRPSQQTSYIKPPLAALKLLKDKAAIKTAFSHYTVGRYLAMARKYNVPVSNTDVTELYSTGIPTRKQRTTVKASFSPFRGKKTKSAPFAGFAGGLKQAASSSTAYLYGPPKTNVVKKADAAAPEPKEKSTTCSSAQEYKTFSKSNPVALKYHGLAILNRTRFPTWESYFEQLLEQPKEALLVESYHGHIPTFEIDIEPASLVRRMLAVRLQVAQEFEHDLQVIADLGGEKLIGSSW